MKLTKKDRKLVEKSIKHWNEDIIKPLEEGHTEGNYIFPLGSDNCDLCKEYNDCENLKARGGCVDCPYFKKYNSVCDDKGMPYDRFLHYFTIFRANRMVKSLEAIIKED